MEQSGWEDCASKDTLWKLAHSSSALTSTGARTRGHEIHQGVGDDVGHQVPSPKLEAGQDCTNTKAIKMLAAPPVQWAAANRSNGQQSRDEAAQTGRR